MAGEVDTLTQPGSEGAPDFWQAPEEFARTEEFETMLRREFPDDADTWTNPVTRRQFMTLMGASVALAGLNGCSPRPAPQRKILPYTNIPEGMIPGNPMFFATGTLLSGVATGVLVKSHEGRPVKVEGNPSHPGCRNPKAQVVAEGKAGGSSNLAGTDIYSQAAILSLYDPDRSQRTSYLGESRTWEDAVYALRVALEKHASKEGAGVRILTETITSPTLADQITKLLAKYPKAKWVQYEPGARDNVRIGLHQATGANVTAIYDYIQANVIVALDSDFLTSGPGAVRYARDFAARRRVRKAKADGVNPGEMNRLYSVEPMLTPTGASADHRLPWKGAEIEAFAKSLLAELKAPGSASVAKEWIKELAKDLLLPRNKGKSIVVTGDHQPASVHLLVHQINEHLQNVGKTVTYVKSIEARPENQAAAFKQLVKDMNETKVELLFILGGNPVYYSPADLDFVSALRKVPLRVHVGDYEDETGVECHWHLPLAHVFETWGDARAYDGTVTIFQPLIAPLYGAHNLTELLFGLTAAPETPLSSSLDLLQDHWMKWYEKNPKKDVDFEHFWENAVREGVIAGTAMGAPEKGELPGHPGAAVGQDIAGGMEVNFRLDPTLYDGRFANLGWLQELPKPITKLTWDNAAIMSPKTAANLGLTVTPRWTAGERGRMEVDMVKLIVMGKEVTAGVWIQPGHVDDSVTVYLGYGRENAGRVGNNTGFNAYKIRFSDSLWMAAAKKPEKTGETMFLACTQAHHNMENRKPVRRMTLQQLGDPKSLDKEMAPPAATAERALVKDNVPGPNEASERAKRAKDHEHEHDHSHEHEHEHEHDEHDSRLVPLTLYPATNKDGRRWAMAIDLTSCIGCNSCMIACQAENNIPVIGKHEVTRGREMHWIRVDRYFEGNPDESEALKTYFQPVPCQQCEKAPCELVCPVGATVHSTDGLNDMVYNRCVGTRYCSNNCPYKVRRFNFFTFADFATESLKLGRNPEVTVRSRGVMEKCTYCVQRIRAGEIVAEREGREIEDGEIVSACQAACPTGAIVFGDLSDTHSEKEITNPVTGAKHKVKGSDVRRWKGEETNYGLLAELNTMPRTSYLADLRNPNPLMPPAKGGA
jgi:molybdopterin-containing oxidoreductase family iron-sulfur binding subunit